MANSKSQVIPLNILIVHNVVLMVRSEGASLQEAITTVADLNSIAEQTVSKHHLKDSLKQNNLPDVAEIINNGEVVFWLKKRWPDYSDFIDDQFGNFYEDVSKPS